MTERKRTVRIFFSLSLSRLHVRFRNAHYRQHDKGYGKDTHSNKQCRRSIADLCISCVTDQITYENRDDRCRNGIQRTTELNQLISSFSSTTQCIQHRVHDRIQHTHRKTGNKCTCKINSETTGVIELSRKKLNTYTDKTNGNSCKSRFFISYFFKHHTRRNTHKSISDKIGGITQLSHPVRNIELILYNYTQRIGKSRYK